MSLSEPLINDNGISAIALAFFTALFSALGVVILNIYQLKVKAQEAKDEAIQAKQAAQIAQSNTNSVANGFANGVNRKLDHISERMDSFGIAFRKHLEYHLDEDRKEG